MTYELTAKVNTGTLGVKVVTWIIKEAYLISFFLIFDTFKNHFESRLSRKSLLSSISSFLGSDVEIRADALIPLDVLFEVSNRIKRFLTATLQKLVLRSRLKA